MAPTFDPQTCAPPDRPRKELSPDTVMMRPPAVGHHPGHDGARKEERTVEVHRRGRAPLLRRHLGERHGAAVCGVGDDHVDPAELIDPLGDQPVHLGLNAHIGHDQGDTDPQCLALVADGLGVLTTSPRVDDHIRTPSRQLEHGRPSQAPARTGDERHLPLQAGLLPSGQGRADNGEGRGCAEPLERGSPGDRGRGNGLHSKVPPVGVGGGSREEERTGGTDGFRPSIRKP